MTAIGNDLIDFRAAHNRYRARQPRILARVLTASERTRLADADAGDIGFALLWSAKEAAYKAVKKIQASLVFAPRRWQVECADLKLSADVTLPDHAPITVTWRPHAHWLHCTAVHGPSPDLIDSAVAALAEFSTDIVFSEDERDSFSSESSAAVRALARKLLAQHGVTKIKIVRERGERGLLPPRVFSDGMARDDIQLSLSHDGDYVAVAIAL